MIYYPDEAQTPSWANPALGALGYNTNPAKLQMLIRKAYDEATRQVFDSEKTQETNLSTHIVKHLCSTIRIEGSEVIAVPLFNVLDGKRSEDYIARVEPSAIGGRKMAEFFLDLIETPTSSMSAENRVNAPTSGLMADRT